MNWAETQTPFGRVALDPAIGNLRLLEFQAGDRVLTPLHSAPWAGDPDLVADSSVLPVEACLAGDFLCAPFGASDLIDGPAHGWTANSAWTPAGSAPGALHFELQARVMGAEVSKTLRLAPDAPLLYQTHLVQGGEGRIPVAHHPMVRMQGRGWLSTSPKRAVLTPVDPLDHGRNRLALGARVTDLSQVPTVDGDMLDLHHLPIATRHEDFVTLIEAPGATLGWTAVIREDEDDIVFVLKDPAVLPVTMLWHSNAGRDFAPWNGRHTGVLGIEDGCAPGPQGHRYALNPNSVADEGVPTAMTLGGTIRIAHVIGAIPRPTGWTRFQSITATGGELTLTEAGGASRALPFDTEFLTKEP